MITAVVFDCFGVLVSDGWLPFKQRNFGSRPEQLAEAARLNQLVDDGRISYDTFVQALGQLAGLAADQVRQEISRNAPNEELFQYIETELKPRYRLGLLSNIGADLLPRLLTSAQLGLFEARALSYETGWVKPEPEAYREIARRLQTPLEECLLIDDQAYYCEAARAVGMPAVRFVDMAMLRSELEQHL